MSVLPLPSNGTRSAALLSKLAVSGRLEVAAFVRNSSSAVADEDPESPRRLPVVLVNLGHSLGEVVDNVINRV